MIGASLVPTCSKDGSDRQHSRERSHRQPILNTFTMPARCCGMAQSSFKTRQSGTSGCTCSFPACKRNRGSVAGAVGAECTEDVCRSSGGRQRMFAGCRLNIVARSGAYEEAREPRINMKMYIEVDAVLEQTEQVEQWLSTCRSPRRREGSTRVSQHVSCSSEDARRSY